MVMTVSNQNYAGMGHIAYYWSPDWGDTWIGHPDNPIIAPGQFTNGVPQSGFQRTPAILVDDLYNRYILVYNAGHDVSQAWKRRTYVATASRPVISHSAGTSSPESTIRFSNTPNPIGHYTDFHFNIDRNEKVRLSIYDLQGRLISCIADQYMESGQNSVRWFPHRSENRINSGIYISRLESGTKISVIKIVVL